MTRYAIYYAPASDDPLWEAASIGLGRVGATGAARPQPDLPEIAEITADARHYGFHATLKPPMRLAEARSAAGLEEAAATLAAGIAPFDLPPLAVTNLHGFLALCETVPCPPLQALSDLCVAGLDEFRAPPGEAELARRRRNGLPAAQEAMLQRWGYPYVFGTWFFHLTLTRRLDVAEHAVYRPEAEAHFAPAIAVPRRVRDICLFVQDGEGAFTLARRFPLRG